MGLIIMITIFVVIAVIAVGAGFFLRKDYDMSGFWTAIVCAAIVTTVGILSSVGVYYSVYHNDHVAVCTITGKDRGGDDGSYRIYTSDCGTLANEDSMFRTKYNSADIWQQIPSKGRVELRIVGYRNGFLSQFPNIIEVRPAPVR